MKTIRYYIMSLALAFTAIGCSDDVTTEAPKANKGDEVQFGATLPGTRTIYGEETSTGFPVYWVDGDLVQVCSPQCLNGRNNAEYRVNADVNKNYANSLTPSGDYGVQWGDAEQADFYSVYPSGSAALSYNGSDVTASLSIANAQTATPKTTDATDLVFEPSDMRNVVMLAKTSASKADESVNLHYIPFSTVVEFALPGPTNAGEMGASDHIIVQTITLTAPDGTNIAGDFDFSLGSLSATTAVGCTDNLTATNVRNASNSMLVHLLDRNNAYATVKAGETLKVKMCLIPQPYTSLEGWTVTVKTNDGNYTKTIKNSELNSDAEKNKLKSGYVHKVTLPALNYKGEWTPTLANWIPELPDYTNIYLSEISLPGAWYAGAKVSDGYQNTTSIAELWSLGIRAFAFECRSRSTTGWGDPNRIVLSGTGSKAFTTDAYINTTDYIAPRIKTIADNIKSNEYGVLILSYADGGEGGTRPIDYSFFLAGVQNEIAQSGASNIYSDEITPETTIETVLGKLIIVVAIDDNLTLGSYSSGMNSLICYNPFPTQLVTNNQSLAEPHFSKLYWKSWGDANKVLSTQNNSDLLWCFSSANRTDCTNTTSEDGTVTNTEVATLSQRKKALSSMGVIADQIYDASSHNVWFYFGAGGTSATSKSSSTDSKVFAQHMNSWLLTAIQNKVSQNKPSPLGIVMFNQCGGGTNYSETDYHGAAIIDAIIKMNSRFYLKHAGTNGGNTGGSTGGGSESGGSGSETTNTAQNNATWSNGGSAI